EGGRSEHVHGELAVRRDLLPIRLPRQPCFRRLRAGGEEGPGALHRRGDEADERDRGRAAGAPLGSAGPERQPGRVWGASVPIRARLTLFTASSSTTGERSRSA